MSYPSYSNALLRFVTLLTRVRHHSLHPPGGHRSDSIHAAIKRGLVTYKKFRCDFKKQTGTSAI